MPGTVHALLVGIDNYPRPEHRLSGCRNDVSHFEALLRARIPAPSLRLKTLLDNEATRESVISAFRDHLGNAGRGDTALFFYAGHGSQERTPPEFLASEPDGLDETLVLWDSREAGHWDLADKELAALIREVSSKGPHTVVILDCCHSGSGTRRPAGEDAPKVRRFPRDARVRPLESLLPEARAAASRDVGESGWDLSAEGRHILFAACRDDQEAAEYAAGDRKRGAFSYFLMTALADAPATVTHRDLAAIARARVAAVYSNQMPQIEATEDADLDRMFLGGAIAPRRRAFLAAEKDGEWWIDAGDIQGIAHPRGSERVSFALFESTATATQLNDVGNAAARAEAIEVQAASSRLRVVRGMLQSGRQYKAVVIGVPVPRREVRLSGEDAAKSEARAALAQSVETREAASGGDFLLECAAGDFRIRNGHDLRLLTAPAATAKEAVGHLDHIAQWMNLAELENPASAIEESEFAIAILEGRRGDQELPGREIRFTSGRSPRGLVPREFRLRMENRGQRDLYFAVLAMDELYSCATNLIPAGVLRIRPGDGPGWALNGRSLKSEVPAALRREGRTESRDILKVIVSNTDFEVRHAALNALRAAPVQASRGIVSNSLDRLLARRRLRTISAASDSDSVSDFRTYTVVISTVEPKEQVDLSAQAPVEVGEGVTIEPHPTLGAKARLSVAEATRSDLGAPPLPPLLRSFPEESETICFTSARGASPGLSVLELSDVSSHESVTPENPLVVRLPQQLKDGEVVLPIGFDGEDYLVLGYGASLGGRAAVTLQRLPHPVQQGTRSLTGSIRILFQKFSSEVLDTTYRYPVLAYASWDATGKVHFEKDRQSIRAKVAAARRVIVFVHGIIGDTFAMGARLAPKPDDAYLTFDYENLDTTIEENAAGLEKALEDHGLGEGHGKELILIAHSMGGLISRWFIEVLGGRTLVSRLILCGTPNGGSSWATIEDFLTSAASLAINGLTRISWSAAAVGRMFAGLPRINNSLKQMKPGSGLLTTLAVAGDPGVPYAILAGNTSLAGSGAEGRVRRLLKKVVRTAVAPAFLFTPNDVAVSVESIGSVSASRVPKVTTKEVACDHMSYFSNDASVAELRTLLALN
ncbi:MAG TPA: alpha/beta fold hydrolase [Bryobacteraceae bacterium]|nr:alpha/beta fold hydrolase [Bryobacteraceae bacterium]